MVVYLNGEYIDKDNAVLSLDDRGFLFADGVYEVVRLYGGKWFEAEAHFTRLIESMDKIRIRCPDILNLPEIAGRLLESNPLPDSDVRLYIQVTRGVAPRTHAFPPTVTAPTVYANVATLSTHPDQIANGMIAITTEDQRWARCDIKSTALLPNVLAHQEAIDAGAHEAIFIKDGLVTEATHNSVMAVIDGKVRTAPLSNEILPSVTRRVVLDLCREFDIEILEEPITEGELGEASELLVTGTACEVTPVVELDGKQIGTGSPGEVSRRLQRGFIERATAGHSS